MILSAINPEAARKPLRAFGSTGVRKIEASVSPDVKGHTVIDLVSPKMSS